MRAEKFFHRDSGYDILFTEVYLALNPTMICQSCGKSYLWKRNKSYCSEICRINAHRKASSAKDIGHWQQTPLKSYELDLDVRNLSNRDHDQYVILNNNNPAGAACYRAGCFNAGNELIHGNRLRWFPSPLLRRPSVFMLEPFVWPQVPFPGEYLIAYFDAKARFLGMLKLRLKTYDPDTRWGLGDLKMNLDKNRLVNQE